MSKPAKIILGVVIGVLAGLGIFFVLIMLAPDDTPHTEKVAETKEVDEIKEVEEAVYEAEAENTGIPVSGEPTVSVGTKAESATILIFMNGSDLETGYAEASTDISEMLSSGIGDNVNVVMLTLGTKEWHEHGISSDTAQIYRIKDKKLELLEDNLGDLNLASSRTLSDFISYGTTNFPADRYLMLFWDHGGGPVYGVGYDDKRGSEDALTLDKMVTAFSEHPDIKFDIVGMDCCIMANMETGMALAPYCRYAVLSEDFESGLGWYYTGWMHDFEENPGMSTPLLGKQIIDSMVKANEEDNEAGDDSSMTLVNVSAMDSLFSAWLDYAYENQDTLLGTNYSTMHQSRGRSFLDQIWGSDYSNVTLDEYFISDMLAIVENVGVETEKTKALRSALKAAIAYYAHSGSPDELTGLSVSLPYGDEYFYEQLVDVYSNLGFDKDYIDWLGKFVEAEGMNDHYDYSDFSDSWGGWGSYEEDYGCSLSGIGTGNCGGEYCDEYVNADADDWTYDYEDEVWYYYDDGLYLYDDESDTMMYYDEYDDLIYYYDESYDEWYEVEDWG